MEWPREKFWYESRIALPATGEPAVFDRQADIMQIGLLALALLEGRTVYAERRYPLPLAQHVAAAREVPLEGPARRVSPALAEWLARALQRDGLSAFTTIEEALTALDQVIDEGRYDARLSTVAAFVTRCRQASPDLKPRDFDPAREAERLPHLTPRAITPAHVPSRAGADRRGATTAGRGRQPADAVTAVADTRHEATATVRSSTSPRACICRSTAAASRSSSCRRVPSKRPSRSNTSDETPAPGRRSPKRRSRR